MVFGVVSYLISLFLPVFQGPLETIIVVSAFAAPMLGFLLTLPFLFSEQANWRTLALIGFITAYYIVLLFGF